MPFFSDLFGVGKDDPGKWYLEQAQKQYENLNAPTGQDLSVQLAPENYVGDYTPEMEQLAMLGPSAYDTISTDPAARIAQMRALASLQDEGNQNGMTAMDRSGVNDILSQIDANDRGRRQAIMQNSLERGMGGSGNELVAQLMNAQDASQNAHSQGLQLAAQARQRALDAISQAGNLGGQIDQQQFNQAAQKAAAKDAIEKFNAANRQQVYGANTQAVNDAALRNVNARQNIAGTNTSIANQQNTANANAKQQAYEDQLARLNGMSGQAANLANGARQSQQAQNAFEGQMIGTAANLAGGLLAKKPQYQYPYA